METCLFEKPLLSNGYCIFAYLAAVAWQRVHMLKYLYFAEEKSYGSMCMQQKKKQMESFMAAEHP
jgi:hypothetical protein